jgi:hypothetical protein
MSLNTLETSETELAMRCIKEFPAIHFDGYYFDQIEVMRHGVRVRSDAVREAVRVPASRCSPPRRSRVCAQPSAVSSYSSSYPYHDVMRVCAHTHVLRT